MSMALPMNRRVRVRQHSPARGLCELRMEWGLLEPLIHSHLGAIVTMDGRELN